MKLASIKLIASAAVLALGLASTAQAITFTSSSVAAFSGTTGAPTTTSTMESTVGFTPLTLLYSAIPFSGSGNTESGPFAASYITDNLPNDDIEVDQSGSSFITGYGSLYLLAVKESTQSPVWKIYNLAGWNGTSDIELDEIFGNDKDIRSVYIFGGNSTSSNSPGVPDSGSSVILLGSAMAALGLIARRRKVA